MRLPIRLRGPVPPTPGPTSWRDRLPAGGPRLLVLCLFIVLIGMIRPRLTVGAAQWLLLSAGIVIALAALAFVAATWRVADRFRAMRSAFPLIEALRVLIRRTGLPLLALGFFLFWTFVYLGLWWYRPGGSFTGLGAHPRFADFFYYAVSTAFVSPPGDIIATSRGARSATMIEMLTGFALLSAWLSSLFELRREAAARRVDEDGPQA